MNRDNWKLWSLNFVIVFSEIKNDFKDIPSKLKKSFDGKETVLPIPDDAQKEIPRIIIPSSDGFRVEISKERINLIFESPKEPKEDLENREDLKEKVENILDSLDIDISWVGMILRHVNENDRANENMKPFINDKEIFLLGSNEDDLSIKFHERLNGEKLVIEEKRFEGDLNMELGSNIRKINSGEQIGNLLVLDMNTSKTRNCENYDRDVLISFVDTVFEKQENNFTKLVDVSNEQ